MPFILFYRNQAYQASKQLAVLDNNAHCLRDQASNKAGTAIHARKFRNQSKKCDVAPVNKTKIIDTICRVKTKQAVSKRIETFSKQNCDKKLSVLNDDDKQDIIDIICRVKTKPAVSKRIETFSKQNCDKKLSVLNDDDKQDIIDTICRVKTKLAVSKRITTFSKQNCDKKLCMDCGKCCIL